MKLELLSVLLRVQKAILMIFFIFFVLISADIYAQNVSYVTLNDDNAIAGRTVDVSKPVGATAGIADVSTNGAATYRIPIAVPPGTNGMIPQIGLVYNSQVGNGIAGYGWSLSGTSAISRTQENLYIDNKVTPVSLATSDQLILDGQRLLRTIGANGVEYKTEIESFSVITGNMQNGFIIKTKDGLIKEYGKTTDSKVRSSSNSVVLQCKLNKISDNYGNYIDFKYTNLTVQGSKPPITQNCLAEINYTGNSLTNMAPYNRIAFGYKERKDKNIIYQGGDSLGQAYLIDYITIFGESNAFGENNTLFKTYQLKYGYDEFYSVLNEIVETGSELEQLNSTVFEYGKSGVSFDYQNHSWEHIGDSWADYYPGDFNGDGFTDILESHYITDDPSYNDSFHIYKHIGNSWVMGAHGRFDGDFNRTLNGDQTRLRNFFGFIPTDFDGNGSSDFIVLKQGTTDNTLQKVIIYRIKNDANSFDTIGIASPSGYNIVPLSGNCFYLGDFNGDARSDFITILGSNSGEYKAYISFPALNSRNNLLTFVGINVAQIAQAPKIYVIDFDGDGKAELLTTDDIGNSQIYSITKTGNSYTASPLIQGLGLGYPTKWHDIYLGDFNGDKKTDILTKSPDFGWSVGYSTGKKFSEKRLDWGNYVYDKVITGDYNGDGKTDILRAYFYSWDYGVGVDERETNQVDIYYSNGIDFYMDGQHQFKTFNGLDGDNWKLFDYNGDGQQDVIVKRGLAGGTRLYLRPNSQNRLLKKVSDGLHNTNEFNYALLTGGDFVYKRNMASVYPLNISQPGAYVVNSFKGDDGIGGTYTNFYAYENALFERTYRGFMGFSSINITSQRDATITNMEYDLNTTYYAMALKKVTTSLLGGQRLWQNYNENSFVSLGGKRFYVVAPFTKERDLLAGTTKYTVNVFDIINGNITSSISTNNGIETVTNNYSNWSYAGTPFLSKPQTVTTTIARGNSTVSSTTNYQYNTTTGGIESKIELANESACKVTTNYQYYPFGGMKKQTVLASGLPDMVTQYTYEEKGRFPHYITNPNNQTAAYVYDPLWGKVRSYTGIDNLTTTYTYDGFGRLKTATVPQGYTINTSYLWDATQGTSAYYSNTQDISSPDLKVWYDKQNREVQRKTEGFNGAWLTSTTQYDTRGNVYKTTLPHYDDETILYSQYEYNETNQLRTITDNTGSSSYTYTYSSGNLTASYIDEDGKISSKTTDATGKVIASTDLKGTLNFTYDGWGNVLTVKLGSNTVITNQYDNCGRQKQMTDKNSGQTNYTYNAYGQLILQKDALGREEHFSYNVLGQLTSRTPTEGVITYEYEPTGSNGVNLPHLITTTYNGYTQQFDYDQFSRPTDIAEMIDGNTFSKHLTYDDYDNLTQVNYNTGLILNRHYDDNGYLQSITNGTAPIYIVNAMSGLGQCTSYALGNGKTSTITYTNGSPTHFYTEGVQNLQLAINFHNGNIAERNDSRNILKREVFAYDEVERLLSVTSMGLPFIPGNTILTMGYADNGNISSKSDMGTYTYNASKINAVKQITNPNGVVPNQAQDIIYSSFGQPTKITEAGKELHITYGADGLRRKSEFKNVGETNPLWTRYYAGDFERQVIHSIEQPITQDIYYINGVNGLVCMAVTQNLNTEFHYTYTDHLGSILTVTDHNGNAEAQQSFDVWGQKRNPATWAYDGVPSVPNWLYRGFTGHEHLPEFNLINMNGRLYDPLLARMLSPDNDVQDPYFSQSFNRYSYVWNNPLKYSDPSGEDGVFELFGEITLSGSEFGAEMYLGPGPKSKNGGQSYSNAGAPFKGKGESGGLEFSIPEVGDMGAMIGYGQSASLSSMGDMSKVTGTGGYSFEGFGGNGGGNANYMAIAGLLVPGLGEFELAAIGTVAIVGIGATTQNPNSNTMPLATKTIISTAALVAKMNKEIEGIRQRVEGPQGFQYALAATNSGYYPNVRGGTTFLNAGDVWKYGETTSPPRYSDKYLNSMRLKMIEQFYGNQMQIKVEEKIKIYGYFLQNWTLPPGNYIFR